MRIKLIVLMFCISNWSCHNTETILKENGKVSTIFSDVEINDLNRILNFVDNQICEAEKKSTNDYRSCYDSFFKRLNQELEKGKYETKFSYEDQMQLVKSITPKLKEEIWSVHERHLKRKIPNSSNSFSLDTIEVLTINSEGRLIELFETMEGNEKVKFYVDLIKKVGVVSPTMIADLIVNYSTYDIADERVRLLIGIHYLTINENHFRTDQYDNEF